MRNQKRNSFIVFMCLLTTGCTAQLNKRDVVKKDPDNVVNNKENNTPKENNKVQPRTPSTFECDPSQLAEDLPLKRLSKVQYQNTLRDLLSMSLSPQSSQMLMGELTPSLLSYPDDALGRAVNETHGGFKRLDQALQQSHIDASFAIASAVGKRIGEDDNLLTALVGTCATDQDASNDEACIESWVQGFGAVALRGQLSASDVAFYKSVYDAQGIDRKGIADVITVMLTAPQFLYHTEHGVNATDSINDKPYDISAMELANRLSYHFWQSMPDEALLAVARDGTLLQDDVYKQQVQRMVSDMKTTAALGMFFREWLWLDEVPELDGLVGTPLYDAFTAPNKPTATLRQAMLDEIENLATYYTLTTDGTFDQLFTSQGIFTTDPELAAIYGVQAWDGQSAPAMYPEGERAGLITRAALIVNGTPNTRPIKKGFLIRKALLCVQPPPPPDNAAGAKVELSESLTTRQVVEQLTEQEGSNCQGCHQLYLNPLGFATEGYDALGRRRTEQRLFNAQGEIVATKPVDPTSIPRIFLNDMTPSKGSGDLSQLLVESKEVHKCFAQNYVRFTLGRVEDTTVDGCMLEDVRSQLVAGKSLKAVLMSVALRPAFKQRNVRAQ